MTLRQLLKKSGIKKADLDREILFFSDEELNQAFTGAEISEDENGTLLLYPLSGTEKGE